MDEDSNRNQVETLKQEFELFWSSVKGQRKVVKKVEVGSELKSMFEANRRVSGSDLKDQVFEEEVLEEIKGKNGSLSPEHLRSIVQVLSRARNDINRKLESIHKEIETNSHKLDSLRLVGSGSMDTIRKLTELNEIGLELSKELSTIDDKLKVVRRPLLLNQP